MTRDNALAPLRIQGMRLVAALLWANVALILPLGYFLGNPDSWIAFILAVGATILPTWCVRQQRYDAQARLIFGASIALFPMLLVFLFRGNPWQMDMHMYFFVCFSLMILMYDSRPVLLATGLTVAHHLVFFLLVPDWVFQNGGSIGRVLLHGFIVACQVAILIATIRQIAELTLKSRIAHADADQARVQAEHARHEAERALEASRLAEQRADQAHRERLAAEAALKSASDDRRMATADEIEASVGSLIADLRQLSEEFAGKAGDVNSTSIVLTEEAAHLRDSSLQAVDSIADMARNAEELASSIRMVGSNAQTARSVATKAAESIATLGPSVQKLGGEVDTAQNILRLVSEIASESNLLALNASIEAARSGEAGRGFAVVAAEMKQMAHATARAADEISDRLNGIVSAADAFRIQIGEAIEQVHEITGSSSAIASAVEQQRLATEAIARGAETVRFKVTETDARSLTLSNVAGRNKDVADSTTNLSGELSERARGLSARMEGLLAQLRAA